MDIGMDSINMKICFFIMNHEDTQQKHYSTVTYLLGWKNTEQFNQNM